MMIATLLAPRLPRFVPAVPTSSAGNARAHGGTRGLMRNCRSQPRANWHWR
jgi:hypothetical protein